ncbi:MAG TPA: phosphotransferase [Casimicrobiaceae bacterium]|nr:phosphotransferase [Casimicrobiaceae bacterium]
MSAPIEPDPRLPAFLERAALVKPGETMSWTPLTGGVSSDIWRVDLPGRTICVKCALPLLKVATTWQAPVERNAYEWAWINFAARYCPDNVPRPLASDEAQGIFAMSYLDPARYPNWKKLLLDGTIDSTIAGRVGAIVSRLHAASAGDASVAATFRSDAIFRAIRLEPYLLATAAAHPDIAATLRALSARTASTRIALVHGDVSPKNILVGPREPVLLDAECAWYGDTAFDAAFCLNHFLLKCVARPARALEYLECYRAFASAYIDGVTWEPREAIEARIATLLPALTLARIDGKSPVEYLTDEGIRRQVRSAARALIIEASPKLEVIATYWRRAFAN